MAGGKMLLPEEFAAEQRRARRHCTVCTRVPRELVKIADTSHRDKGTGSATMAGWLQKVASITLDHNVWVRHWNMQANGTHP